LRASASKRGRDAASEALSAQLAPHVTFEVHPEGRIIVCFEGHSVGLGEVSAGAADRAQALRTGLPLHALASSRRSIDKEVDRLVRRLARHGLLEYCLGRSRDGDAQIVIEPQVPDYWPRTPPLDNSDVLVLSRFAYMRRRGNDMVLESPRAGALFKICDARIATALAALATAQAIKQLRRQDAFPGLELLALLVDCQILFKVDPARDIGPRLAEGDDNLVLWDFHDLLFHARSAEGRHANPLGGVYPYADTMPALPAVRPCWPGKAIALHEFASRGQSQPMSSAAKLLRERHSTRSFDDRRPITVAELACFLDGAARVQSRFEGQFDDASPAVEYAVRPYPSAGGSYELEIYLAVDACEGLARGFYHYDAGAHALVPIAVPPQELEAQLRGAQFAMGAPAAPQILITIAARFGRVSWKYSSIAFSLILKDAGVLMQTFYLMATDMGLGGCAIGIANLDLFAKMTGIEFHVEGPVGQFALGRAAPPTPSD
jgi:SagB-type dehydrogenase family enzyme